LNGGKGLDVCVAYDCKGSDFSKFSRTDSIPVFSPADRAHEVSIFYFLTNPNKQDTYSAKNILRKN
jgi:hypothetical protein